MTELDIIHFNDVYNIEPSSHEPVGGAARFVHAINQYRTEDTMILFSGDVLSPSLLSTITCGRQMTSVLKAIGVHCAVFGNHDFDFGVENAQEFAAECNFPWLLSNCALVNGGEPLAGGLRYHVMERKDIRVGLLGLIEEEWVDTLNTIDSDEVYVADFVDTATTMAAELREKHGCRLVIALTHMRWPNDRRLASESSGIDLVLGGHDHNYGVEQVNGVYVIKSGTDFREFNIIRLRVSDEDGTRPEIMSVSPIQITSQLPEDLDIKLHVNEYFGTLDTKMQQVIGYTDVPLDCRFSVIRTEETNVGNLIADIMLMGVDADVALLNSGTLRADQILPVGKICMRDLQAMLPMLDPIVSLEITGAQLLNALENGVSKYPALEGRFLQVSGVRFAFNPSNPSGNRIDPQFVYVGDQPLSLERLYVVCVKDYLAAGRDGFDTLAKGRFLLDEDCCPNLNTLVRNYFISMNVMRSMKNCRPRHQLPVLSQRTRRRISMIRKSSVAPDNLTNEEVLDKLVETTVSNSQRTGAFLWDKIRGEESHHTCNQYGVVAPFVDGRILRLTGEEAAGTVRQSLIHSIKDRPAENSLHAFKCHERKMMSKN